MSKSYGVLRAIQYALGVAIAASLVVLLGGPACLDSTSLGGLSGRADWSAWSACLLELPVQSSAWDGITRRAASNAMAQPDN